MTARPLLRVERFFEALYAWFYAPVDGRPLFCARIGFGVTLALSYLRYLPDAQALFGPRGVGGYAARATNTDFAGLGYDRFAKLQLLHLVSSEAVVWVLFGLTIASSLAFAAGLFSRASGVTAVILHLLFVARNPHAMSGWGWMIGPYMLYVVACQPGRAFSLDALRATRAGRAFADDTAFLITPWGMRLLQVHLCTMYLVAGWERLDHEAWLRGDMVLWAAADPLYGRFALDWYAIKPVLRALSYVVFVLEPLAPVLLWFPTVGPWCALLLMGMHAGIEAVSETGFWQLMMMSGLLVFLPPRWIDKLRRFIARSGTSAPLDSA